MSWLKRNFALLTVGLLALGAGGWLGWARLQPASTNIDALWATVLPDLSGKRASLAAFKGKPLIVNFWATWCGPCKEEMPDFQKLAASELGSSIQIVGIGIDNTDNMRAFSDKLGISYTLLDGGPGGLDLLTALGNQVGGLPYTLIVDATGRVIVKRLGRISYEELREASMRTLGK